MNQLKGTPCFYGGILFIIEIILIITFIVAFIHVTQVSRDGCLQTICVTLK